MTATRNQKIVKQAKDEQPYCKRCVARKHLVAHHIVALADGGADVLENLDVLCGSCHREWHHFAENNITYDEFLSLPPYCVTYRWLADEELEGQTLSDAVCAWMHYRLSQQPKPEPTLAELQEWTRKHLAALKN
jgi:hypothetical protein